jgi:hypothetical protein|tara:strand:+ start:388 stop:825 length:438 start_codon:yes stop_codon:yes gene_type:complete
MYPLIKILYYYWSYLTLLVIIYAVFNALMGKIKGKDFESKDLRISLFGLIFSHFQLLIGLMLYLVSPWFNQWSKLGVMNVMSNSQIRFYLVEHPFLNIIAIVLITVGWSVHKKQSEPEKKFLRIIIFYGLGLLLSLTRIPWEDLR